jgi:hypothetical protein
LGFKNLLLDADPGWKKFGLGMENIRIRDEHPGSATLIMGQYYYTGSGVSGKARNEE